VPKGFDLISVIPDRIKWTNREKAVSPVLTRLRLAVYVFAVGIWFEAVFSEQ
jgi:hypothetical protein